MDPSRTNNSSTPTNDTASISKLPLASDTISTYIPTIARKVSSFFRSERQVNVAQSDIVIMCVFLKHC